MAEQQTQLFCVAYCFPLMHTDSCLFLLSFTTPFHARCCCHSVPSAKWNLQRPRPWVISPPLEPAFAVNPFHVAAVEYICVKYTLRLAVSLHLVHPILCILICSEAPRRCNVSQCGTMFLHCHILFFRQAWGYTAMFFIASFNASFYLLLLMRHLIHIRPD